MSQAHSNALKRRWTDDAYREQQTDVLRRASALAAQIRKSKRTRRTKPKIPEVARPIIVCLCGSTRFWRLFQRAGLAETMAGRIVLSIGAASGTDDEHFGNLPKAEYDRIKTMLDELHMRKIELADEVLILNSGGYIGESTKRELAYARALGKRVRFWEDESPPPDPPLMADELPGWLLSLSQQADTIESPLVEGWPV